MSKPSPTKQPLTHLITLLCLSQTLALTDMSTNNCPTNFNLTSANTSIGIGLGQLATFFYSSYMGDTQKTRLQNHIIAGQNTQIEQIMVNEYVWPFALIAGVVGLAFGIVVLCVVFEKSCPPCHSWRRDFAKRPYEKFEIRCVAVAAIVFAVGIMATAVTAFTIIPTLQSELKSTKCGLYTTLDVALNGDNKQWGGFSHIKNQVGNISRLLDSTNTQINNYFSVNDPVKTAIDDMKVDNINIYASNANARLRTPQPGSTSTIGSPFVTNNLGPSTQSPTLTHSIQTSLSLTQQLTLQATNIINSAYIIVQSSDTIQQNTATSQQTLSMYQNQLNTFKTSLDTFSNQYFDPVFNWGVYVVEVVIGFVLVASLAVIIGSVSVHLLDIYDCRHFLHFGWVVYGLTYFGIVFTAYFMLPMGSVGYTFCKYYGAMLTNQTQYDRLGQVYAQNVLNRVDICLHGNGNVLQKFQIASEMQTVSNLFIQIQAFKENIDPTSVRYINPELSKQQITNSINIIQDYRTGKTKDLPPLTGQADPVNQLINMNVFTLGGSCLNDRWVYDVGDCQTGDNVFSTPPSQADSLILDSRNIQCISLNTKISQGAAGPWTLTDVQKRYGQIIPTCPTDYTDSTRYAASIIQYRDSRLTLFQGIKDQLNDLLASHNNFNVSLQAFKGNLGAFSSTQAVRDLSNFVTNKIDGLLVSSDCKPIGNHMRFIYNTFCVNSMGYAVQLGICLLVLLCLQIAGVFTGCVFAQRAATIKRLHTIHAANFPVQQQSIHSETFDRKQKSDSSSSSSDQD